MRSLLETDSPLNLILDLFKDKRKQPKKEKDNYTKNLVMTFPTLCDDSLRPETASMISKANERNIVSMLQMLFASMQLKGTNGAEILARLHKNISTSMSMDDAIDALDNIASRTAGGKFFESAKYQVLLRDAIKVVNEQVKKPLKSLPVNSFSEKSLMDYTVSKDYKGQIIVKEYEYDPLTRAQVYDGTYRRIPNDKNPISTGKFNPSIDPKGQIDIAKFNQDTRKNAFDIIKTDQDIRYNKEKQDWARDKHTWDKEHQEIEKAKFELEKQKFERDQKAASTLSFSDRMDSISRQLLDSDVKKANEIAPSLLIVQYSELDTDGSIYDQKSFVTGVKSRLIAVDPGDIIERLIAKNKTKISFLNFIRATTGEIRFVKDFLLCTKQAKIDAKNSVKKGPAAKMWKVLEQRSTKNAFNKMRKSGNDASSITTLVINKETANLMKKEYDFDIENPRNAKMIMDAYNLLAIIVCDESIESAKFMYAGNDNFETQAYSFLEKEDKDKSYKKVISLIGQMNR